MSVRVYVYEYMYMSSSICSSYVSNYVLEFWKCWESFSALNKRIVK